MSEPTKTDHAYDGIEEYDNPLPGWWKWVFIATIAFCPFYWFYYHGGTEGRSIHDGFDRALAANTRLQFAEMGDLAADEATILQNMHKVNRVKVGKVIFRTNCIQCHGMHGEGKVGPNLTDENFKNVKKVEDIATVVTKGANANAMPAWGNRLHPNEIVLLSAYIATLRGTNADGGKAPEGNLIPPWPDPPAEPIDETKSQ